LKLFCIVIIPGKLISLFSIALFLGGCATDTKLGITTNQGPRLKEEPIR
jgi:hypothetical protein